MDQPTQPPTPGLGIFTRLPPEIRIMIWEEFQPRGFDRHSKNPIQKTDLRILQTSKHLYHEITGLLYHQRKLFFNIFPSPDIFPWLTVYDNKGTMWLFPDEADFLARGFGSLPYNKIDLNVNIYAGSPCLQGSDMFTTWKRVFELVPILSKATHLRSLTIKLRERLEYTWHPPRTNQNQNQDEDEEIPFYARHIRDLHIHHKHELVTLPFLSLLETAQAVGAKLDPMEMGDLIDWFIASSARNDEYESSLTAEVRRWMEGIDRAFEVQNDFWQANRF